MPANNALSQAGPACNENNESHHGFGSSKWLGFMEKEEWLIWSNEHNGWWKPNSMGYCRDRKDAGRYDYNEARGIVENANFGLEQAPHEAMVLDADV